MQKDWGWTVGSWKAGPRKGVHCVKYGPEKRSQETQTQRQRDGMEGRGCLDALALPLTLVDVLERTSPTEFHADPELLQPTAVQE